MSSPIINYKSTTTLFMNVAGKDIANWELSDVQKTYNSQEQRLLSLRLLETYTSDNYLYDRPLNFFCFQGFLERLYEISNIQYVINTMLPDIETLAPHRLGLLYGYLNETGTNFGSYYNKQFYFCNGRNLVDETIKSKYTEIEIFNIKGYDKEKDEFAPGQFMVEREMKDGKPVLKKTKVYTRSSKEFKDTFTACVYYDPTP